MCRCRQPTQCDCIRTATYRSGSLISMLNLEHVRIAGWSMCSVHICVRSLLIIIKILLLECIRWRADIKRHTWNGATEWNVSIRSCGVVPRIAQNDREKTPINTICIHLDNNYTEWLLLKKPKLDDRQLPLQTTSTTTTTTDVTADRQQINKWQ